MKNYLIRCKVEDLQTSEDFICMAGCSWKFHQRDPNYSGAFIVSNVKTGELTWFAGVADVVRMKRIGE